MEDGSSISSFDIMSNDNFPYRPCVRSGVCCKKAICPFGEWDQTKHQCKFLEVAEKHDNIEIHRCGKYEEINALSEERGAKFSPAFGGGCCMPLLNEPRRNIIRAISEGRISLVVSNSDTSV